jgi:hypothetical protein
VTALAPRTRGHDDAGVDERPRLSRSVAGALAAFAVLVAVSHVWGRHVARQYDIGIGVPPLHSSWNTRAGWATVGAIALGSVAVFALPSLARRLPWRAVPVAIAASAALWAIVLASNDGTDGLLRGVGRPGDYLTTAQHISSPFEFLRDFAASVRAHEFPVHTSGHPPGFVLVLRLLDQLGLRGGGWATALCITGGVSALSFVAVTVRDVAGEHAARAAMPFLVISPAAIWIVTTPDAFFAGVSAGAVSLLVLATSEVRRSRQALVLGMLGGALYGAALMLSYGLVLVAVIPLAVAWHRRSFRPLFAGALGALAVIVAFAGAGFWWIDGLLATRERYWLGIASSRPLRYFVVANLAAFALVCGPATAVALARVRHNAVRVLVWSALAAALIADLSAMSKGEVERIWLPFAVWLLPAGAVFANRPRLARGLLSLQVVTAIFLQTFVHNS